MSAGRNPVPKRKLDVELERTVRAKRGQLAGDAQVHALVAALDAMGYERTPTQREFHAEFLGACLPSVYGADFDRNREPLSSPSSLDTALPWRCDHARRASAAFFRLSITRCASTHARTRATAVVSGGGGAGRRRWAGSVRPLLAQARQDALHAPTRKSLSARSVARHGSALAEVRRSARHGCARADGGRLELQQRRRGLEVLRLEQHAPREARSTVCTRMSVMVPHPSGRYVARGSRTSRPRSPRSRSRVTSGYVGGHLARATRRGWRGAAAPCARAARRAARPRAAPAARPAARGGSSLH